MTTIEGFAFSLIGALIVCFIYITIQFLLHLKIKRNKNN